MNVQQEYNSLGDELQRLYWARAKDIQDHRIDPWQESDTFTRLVRKLAAELKELEDALRRSVQYGEGMGFSEKVHRRASRVNF